MIGIRTSLILAAILLAVASTSFAQPEQPTPSLSKGRAEKSSQISNFNQLSTQQLPLIVRTVPAPKDKVQAEHEERESHEQRTRERWITYSTIWLAIVTTFLALFTGYLWDATRKLVRSSEETAKRQLRAFIFGKGFNHGPHIWDGTIREYVFWVTWENVGLTPGIDVCSWMEVKTLPINEDQQIIFAPSPERRPTVMGPRATAQTAFITVPLETMMQRWRNEKRIFLWSRVEYRDIFDPNIIHHHEQCVSVELIHEPSTIPPEGHPPYLTFVIYGAQNSTA
jgi:hypothetical protein